MDPQNRPVQTISEESPPEKVIVESAPANVDDCLLSEEDKTVIGTEIAGQYEVLSLIGRGGMSSVYLVTHKILKKNVRALKMIRPLQYGLQANAVLRFKREAEAASLLDHPNVVTIHDFGVSEKGQAYIVMGYIQGVSLAQLIAESGPLPPERAVHIFSQACAALEHAHSRGVIHRDIKPSNIMLSVSEVDPDFVKVVDFGIAKVIDYDEEVQKLTQTGEIFGTPMYMSPEQWQGQPLDARSDIYSLGCVMYEALTGVPPHSGSSPYETMFKHINEVPPGLEKAIPDRQLRAVLETIVFGALAKNPEQRYQSMTSLKQDLDLISLRKEAGLFKRLAAQWYLRQLKRGHLEKRISFKFLVACLAVMGLLTILASFLVLDCLTPFSPEHRSYLTTVMWDRNEFKFAAHSDRRFYGDLAENVRGDLATLLRRTKPAKPEDTQAWMNKREALALSDIFGLFLGGHAQLDMLHPEVIEVVQKMADNFYRGELFDLAAICYEENCLARMTRWKLENDRSVVEQMERNLQRLSGIYIKTQYWFELKGVYKRIAMIWTEAPPHPVTNDQRRMLFCRYAEACNNQAERFRKVTEQTKDIVNKGNKEHFEALRRYEEAASIALDPNDPTCESAGLPEIGLARLCLEENPERSDEEYEKAAQILQQSLRNKPADLAIFLGNYGDFLWKRQHYMKSSLVKLKAALLKRGLNF